eukprot:COSAG01_NODE_6712_length_3532_cov_19.370146_5_plen_49_part_00
MAISVPLNPRQDTAPPNNDATHLQAEQTAHEGEDVGLLPAQAFPSSIS